MPYKRRRTPLKRRRYAKKRVTHMGVYRKIGNYGRYGIGGEQKFFDLSYNLATVATNGTTLTTTLVNIAQGVTESTRIGRKMTLKSIQWRYTVGLPEQALVEDPLGGDEVRIILYLDKQCNGLTAAATDILDTASYQSFSNLTNQGRFKILCDKTHVLNYSGMAGMSSVLTSMSPVIQEHKLQYRMSTPIEFSGVAGVLTEIRSNNYGILAISKNGIITLLGELRMRFTDN